ncbi:MAG TPA: four-helix bundle copper-binding protein [Sphingomicrobium sp.]|jgi:hypothetical protein|nr:four-helix bundle copper-binding protein [Sphingomicrobium sp.]
MATLKWNPYPFHRFGSGEQEKPMSIRKMISLHPQVRGHVNQPLADAVHHLMYCAKMCRSCADSCLGEDLDMVQCIRLCLDCADMCDTACNMSLRQTGDDDRMVREMLELCARMCEACAAECEKYDHEHCKLCAQMCRECAEDCRNAAASITPES